MSSTDSRLKLSAVVVCYEMPRPIENTLRSLLPPYQRDLAVEDYEIILVDNGSRQPLEERLQKLSPNLRYHYLSPNECSANPAVALNFGVRQSRSSVVGLMIDGARLVTPGVLSWGLRLLALAPRALVEVRGWHLGPQIQNESVTSGYDSEEEQKLLAQIRWPEDGYRLWEIAARTPQTRNGYSARTAESNCIFLAREVFDVIGGLDERVTSAGGGWVNLDFFARAVMATGPVFTLLGEGTFHQVHGGAATGLSKTELAAASKNWRAESEALGQKVGPVYDYILAGHLPPECAAWLARHAP